MNSRFSTTKIFFGAAVFSLIFAFSSCNKTPKAEDPKDSAEEINEAAETNDSVSDARAGDSDYLVAAAEMDMMEIDLGKLALGKTSNAKVKELAHMMIDQHTKNAQKVKALAAIKEIVLPAALTDMGKEHHEKLDKKEGKEFDEEYAEMMVSGHEDAIDKTKDASESAKDVDVKKWAADMLPALNAHLEHAKMLQELIKKTK